VGWQESGEELRADSSPHIEIEADGTVFYDPLLAFETKIFLNCSRSFP